MNIVVVGGDGRAHTLLWKIAQSPLVTGLFCAPGNAGTAKIARNIPIPVTDIAGQVRAAKELGVRLAVISPEVPLALGLADAYQAAGILVFGPSRRATKVEASKSFANELMEKYGIPCAKGRTFYTYKGAKDYIEYIEPPYVIKADGLAAGKGVTIAQTQAEAIVTLHKYMVERVLGEAGETVIIAEYLAGREASAMAFTDGYHVKPWVTACDYKRAYNGNMGPNTGGMGSYSPSEFLGTSLSNRITEDILQPIIAGLESEGRLFQGVTYAGLMVADGTLKVLEINARPGDPETQVLLPRLRTDIVEIMLAVANGTLDKLTLEWSQDPCVGVVLASGGYPDHYAKNRLITGLDSLDSDILVFHAGTKEGANPGEILTDGGRVLTVVALGKSFKEARDKVYRNIPRIFFDGMQYRNDIAMGL